ncbi:uncharacterized protein FOMMEDRAFT_96897, partial [Fomitiporia mediterranea MF3/22]|uniref:uncharacterized protein n=1 Tax=Fomitiporia mediterranea (strain MF3/22) TaxID=694068 RepID=UPI0004409BE7
PGSQYCCRRILFNKPDFQVQKLVLEELIKAQGHLTIFYPKYYYKLNFIKQC